MWHQYDGKIARQVGRETLFIGGPIAILIVILMMWLATGLNPREQIRFWKGEIRKEMMQNEIKYQEYKDNYQK